MLDGAVLHVLRAVSTANHYSRSIWQPEDQAEVLKAVRKGLCPVLRDLMAHGLIQSRGTSTSLVPFLSCASAPSRRCPDASGGSYVHPWNLLVAYYRTKDGESLMNHPQRSLAQSFSLEIQGGTIKQGLLMAIGNVLAIHAPYKRGPEAHFKAFIASALKFVNYFRYFSLSVSAFFELSCIVFVAS